MLRSGEGSRPHAPSLAAYLLMTHASPPTLPTLSTGRLLLRPFHSSDAGAVQRLAGDPEVSATALDLPFPFELQDAEAWIETHPEGFATSTHAVFAVTLSATGELVGAAGLAQEPGQGRASLGYWIGKPYWGRGYATEAAGAVVAFGFEGWGLQRIHADHLAGNRASGQVLRKLGMRREGVLRSHVIHRGEVHDLALYGILRSEWDGVGPSAA